uniref:Uncharacterized protein n=1 Tax=Acrobeloides nanus TaxID=290746 RepID=A0A914C1Z6_9BILA
MLCFNAIMTGIQAIMGVHFCANPILFYLLACIGSACWYGTSMVCIELAMNRCLELCLPRLASRLYSGYSLWLWMIFPGVYTFYTYLFEKPAFYNNKYFAWFFDPHAGITGLQDPVKVGGISFFCYIYNV